MLLRTSKGRAEATLVQREFFYPKPPKPGAPVELLWKTIVQANQGKTCTFTW